MPAPDFAPEIAALEAAAATGELLVESDGDKVRYRSMAELLSALSYFRNQADLASNVASRKSSTTVVAFDQG